jgi:hypothetical protein
MILFAIKFAIRDGTGFSLEQIKNIGFVERVGVAHIYMYILV